MQVISSLQGRPDRVKLFSYKILCFNSQVDIQSVGMTQIAIVTKWKFVVEFEDWETREISGTTGQAGTREECEGLIEYDMQYHTRLWTNHRQCRSRRDLWQSAKEKAKYQ